MDKVYGGAWHRTEAELRLEDARKYSIRSVS